MTCTEHLFSSDIRRELNASTQTMGNSQSAVPMIRFPGERFRLRSWFCFGNPRRRGNGNGYCAALCPGSRHSLDHHSLLFRPADHRRRNCDFSPALLLGRNRQCADSRRCLPLPIPASRNWLFPRATVTCCPTRMAGAAIFTFRQRGSWYSPACSYVLFSSLTGHLRKDLLPTENRSFVAAFRRQSSAFALRSANGGGRLVL